MILNQSTPKLTNNIDQATWHSLVFGQAVITIICDEDIPMTRVISEDLSVDELIHFITEQYPGEFVSIDCIQASSFEVINGYMESDEQVTYFALNHPTTTFYDVFVTSAFAWNHANQSGVLH